MSLTIDQSFVTLFEKEVKQKYQEGHRLRGLVREKSVPGAKTVQFPVFGKGLAKQKAIHDDVTPNDVVHTNVSVAMQDWYAADYTDIFRNNQISFDERQELVKSLTMAIGRRVDKLLISALAAATSSTIIDEDLGGPDSDMNFDKFLAAMGALDDAGVPDDGKRVLLMNHRSYRALLTDVKFTSSDFGQIERFAGTSQNPNVKPYLGYKIVTIDDRIERDGSRLGLPKDGITNIVQAMGFHQDALGMGYNMDLKSEINYIPEKLAWLTTVCFSANAVAIDQTGIVRV